MLNGFKITVMIAFAGFPGLAAAQPAPARTAIERLGNKLANRPYTPAVRAGDTLYLSGQVGTAPDGSMPADFEAQVRNVMANVGNAAALGGATMDDLVKCTVMLQDMKLWPKFNQIYVTYFKADHLPARSAFGTNGLALGAEVEVECIAYKPQ